MAESHYQNQILSEAGCVLSLLPLKKDGMPKAVSSNPDPILRGKLIEDYVKLPDATLIPESSFIRQIPRYKLMKL